MVSAFGPTVLSAYAEATDSRGREQPGKALGSVIDYLAERIEPAANTETLSESALYADYQAWCRTSDRIAMPTLAFVAELDHLRRENGLGKIRKRKDRYCGIRLVPPNKPRQWMMSWRRALSRSVAARRGLSSRGAAGRAPPDTAAIE